MATVGEKMTAIANAIRKKTGGTAKLTLDTMASSLNNIPERTSSNLTASGATVTVPAGNYKTQATKSVATVGRANTTISVSADDTNDKLTITASNNQGTGYVTGANKTATKTITLTASGSSVTASDGTNKVSKSVATATQATPSVSINSSGLITASATQTAGYVAAGTKSATKQLTTKAATTITPGTRNQTVAAGTYLTGALTIAGDADLVATNIVSGKNIFGVAGSHTCASNVLNFTVVGGTSQPSSPANNTLWINTSTSITGWEFLASSYPTYTSTNGRVHIVSKITSNNTDIDFNALKSNGMWVEVVAVWQYVSNSWVKKEAKIYQNGSWHELWSGQLYMYGDEYTSLTGGWDYYGLSGKNVTMNISRNTDNITLDSNQGHACIAHIINSIEIDTSIYKTLVATGTFTVGGGVGGNANYAGFFVWNALPKEGGYNSTSNAVAYTVLPSGTKTQISIDLSTIQTGNYYIGFAMHGFTAKINELKLI